MGVASLNRRFSCHRRYRRRRRRQRHYRRHYRLPSIKVLLLCVLGMNPSSHLTLIRPGDDELQGFQLWLKFLNN